MDMEDMDMEEDQEVWIENDVSRQNEDLQILAPPGRTGHIGVSYEKYMIVWGGYTEYPSQMSNTYFHGSELWIYSMVSERWFRRRCCSQFHPPGTSGSAAVVIGDCMYLFGGYGYRTAGCSNKLYKLDLQDFMWSPVRPSGHRPSPVDKMTAWAYDGRLYIFGGFGSPRNGNVEQDGFEFVYYHMLLKGWTNQFFEYDPESNRWSKPGCTGTPPKARAAHSAAVMRNKVYIFGGRHDKYRLNDLHCLDMSTMHWSGELKISGPCPEGRSWQSFTATADRYIVLYGGFSQRNFALSDCWVLDTEALIWTAIASPLLKPRLWHSACLSVFDEILVHGGCTSNILDMQRTPEQASDIVVISLMPKSLFRLCIDFVLQNPKMCPLWKNLPINILKVLELRSRSRIVDCLNGS